MASISNPHNDFNGLNQPLEYHSKLQKVLSPGSIFDSKDFPYGLISAASLGLEPVLSGQEHRLIPRTVADNQA